jgi:hypothetical protein
MRDETYTLQRDEKHFGFWCASGTEVDTFERSGTLARSQPFRGVLLPKGSRFWHDVDFDYLTVESNGPLRLGSHVFGDETRIEFSPRVEWEVWRSWAVWLILPISLTIFLLSALFRRLNRWETVIPSEGMVIDDVPIVPGDRLSLWADGSLRSLLLASPRTIDGRRFETGHLQWNTRGELTEALLYAPQEFDGIPCAGLGLINTEVKFYPDGSLRECVLHTDYHRDETTFPRGSRLRFDRDGHAHSAEHLNIDVSVYSHRPEIHSRDGSAASKDEPR